MTSATGPWGPGAITSLRGRSNWQIFAAADMDGDGKADLLWYNTNTGEAWMIRMNALAVVSGQSVYQEWDLSWGIVNR